MAFSKDFGWQFAVYLVVIPGAAVALIRFLEKQTVENSFEGQTSTVGNSE